MFSTPSTPVFIIHLLDPHLGSRLRFWVLELETRDERGTIWCTSFFEFTHMEVELIVFDFEESLKYFFPFYHHPLLEWRNW